MLFAAGLGLAWNPARAAAPVELETFPAEAASGLRACSTRHRACVLAPRATDPAVVTAALAAADRAWETLTGALGLPAPDPDPGGAGRWRLALVDGVDLRGGAALADRDPVARFDRGESFGLVDRATPQGCPLETAVARAVADGSRLRAAPATDPGSARAESEMLARLATPCAGPDDDLLAFQAAPERTLVNPNDALFDAGASRFFAWLDASFASGTGALVGGLWALAPTRTPPGASRWDDHPGEWDVLRSSLAGALGTDSNLDDVLLAFAVDRAVAAPRAKLAWHIPWPSPARRLASPRPVAPTGASYVMIDHGTIAPGATLRVSAAWEDYGRMKWVVVKLDAAGRATAVLPITSPPLATSAALTVELLDGVDRVLVVGVNVGSTEHPFDPGQGWWEPHGWLLTVDGS